MASSMLAQVGEELSVLDQTLVQPGKLLGLETAVGCEISGFSHPPKSIGAARQKPLSPTIRPLSPRLRASVLPPLLADVSNPQPGNLFEVRPVACEQAELVLDRRRRNESIG